MKKICLMLIIVLTGCQFYKQDVFTIATINLYNDPQKNKQIGADLLYYDYGTMIKDSLRITDNSVLRNIRWESFTTDGTKETTFRLYLNNDAIGKKKELVDFFDHFIADKLTGYAKKKNQIDSATQMGNYYRDLISQGKYDSVWKLHAPLLEKYVTNEAFTNMLKQRNELYSSPESIQLKASIFSNKIDTIPGEMCIRDRLDAEQGVIVMDVFNACGFLSKV